MSSKLTGVVDTAKHAYTSARDFLGPREYETGGQAANTAKRAAVTGAKVAGGAALVFTGLWIPALLGVAGNKTTQAVLSNLRLAAGEVGFIPANLKPGQQYYEFSQATPEYKQGLIEWFTGTKIRWFNPKGYHNLRDAVGATALQDLQTPGKLVSGQLKESAKYQVGLLWEQFVNNNKELTEMLYAGNPMRKGLEAENALTSVTKSWTYSTKDHSQKKAEELSGLNDPDFEFVRGDLAKLDGLHTERAEMFQKLDTAMSKELENLRNNFLSTSTGTFRDRMTTAREGMKGYFTELETKQHAKIDEVFGTKDDKVPTAFREGLRDLGLTDDEIDKRKADMKEEVTKQIANARHEMEKNIETRLAAIGYFMNMAAQDIRAIAFQRNEILEGQVDNLPKTPYSVEARIGSAAPRQDHLPLRLQYGLDPNKLGFQQTQTGTTFSYDPNENKVQLNWDEKTPESVKFRDLECVVGRIISRQHNDLMKKVMAGEMQIGDIPKQTSLEFSVYAGNEKEAIRLAEAVVTQARLKGVPPENIHVSYSIGNSEHQIPFNWQIDPKYKNFREKVKKAIGEASNISSAHELEQSKTKGRYLEERDEMGRVTSRTEQFASQESKQALHDLLRHIDSNAPQLGNPSVGMNATPTAG